jgi:hypothetical protein
VLSVVTDDGSTQSGSLIDEIVREGARRMLAAALEAEVNQYIAELAAEADEYGRRVVVRNGHHRPRTVVTAAGPVEVKAPRINDRRVDDESKRFSSKIVPPWCRKSPKISEVLPLLYLHGLSSGDFVPALVPAAVIAFGSGRGGQARGGAAADAGRMGCRTLRRHLLRRQLRHPSRVLPRGAAHRARPSLLRPGRPAHA